MKGGTKPIVLFLAFSIVLILSLNLVSAGWFEDLTDFFKRLFGFEEEIEGEVGELPAMAPGYGEGEDCYPCEIECYPCEDLGELNALPPGGNGENGGMPDGENGYTNGDVPPDEEDGVPDDEEDCYPCEIECYPCEEFPDGEEEPSCIPKTCAQLGKECGIWDDGCGKELDCGTCPDGEECNIETGQCEICVPDCTGIECGLDPICGQRCGVCPDDTLGDPFCGDDNNLHRFRTSYSCNLQGTCDSSQTDEIVEDCVSQGKFCENGLCIETTESLFDFTVRGPWIELNTEIRDGFVNNFHILYGDGTQFTIVGDKARSRLKTSNTNTLVFNDNTDEHFFASWYNGPFFESYLLSASVQYSDGVSVNYVRIKNIITEDEYFNIRSGEVVSLGNLRLTIEEINKDERTIRFAINSGGFFDRIYNEKGDYIVLPKEYELPVDRYRFEIKDKFENIKEAYEFYWGDNQIQRFPCEEAPGCTSTGRFCDEVTGNPYECRYYSISECYERIDKNCLKDDICIDGACIGFKTATSIATLKDKYSVGEQIKLTDPPEESNSDITNEDAVKEIVDFSEIKGKGKQKDISYLTEKQVKGLAILNEKKISESEELKKSKDEDKKLKIEGWNIINPLSYIKKIVIKRGIRQQERNLEKTELELQSALIDYGVPEEIQNELDTFNEKAKTWKANYNSVFIKSEENQKKLTGLLVDESKQEEISSEIGTTQTLEEPVGSTSISGLPDSFDWRNVHGKNYITPIKDQGACGSCWAFSAAAVLEGAINAYYNDPNLDVDLSEQDLVSCFHGSGCRGATESQIGEVFSDYYQTKGLCTETCFPYTETNDDCNNKCPTWQNEVWKIVSYKYSDFLNTNIESIKRALVEYGPIEVGMEVYEDFLSYSGGIYNHVSGNLVGYHAVTIVGYDKYDGMDCWIVKNSWGESWGEDGYFRILMGESKIDSWFAYAVDTPISPYSKQKLCSDNDNDRYCNWGLGEKPTEGCPICDSVIKDCDDFDSSIFVGCGVAETGSIAITSTPSNVKVYVRDMSSGDFVYRGTSPLSFNLNAGNREIKISKIGYLDYNVFVDVVEGEETSLEVILEHDPQFLEGWPQQVYWGISESSPIIVDLDNDGDLEIIVGSYDGKIYAWHHDGTIVNGWPQNTRNDIHHTTPAVGDLDNDGNVEVVVVIGDYIFIWDKNGNLISSWFENIVCNPPVSADCSPTLVDFNGDGALDILVVDSLYIKIFNSLGDTLFKLKLPTTENENIHFGPAVGDLDNDGDLEIIVGASYYPGPPNSPTGKVYALHHDGVIVDGWPQDTTFAIGSHPILGDINNDGVLEILIFDHKRITDLPHYNPDKYTLYVWDSEGNLLWDKEFSAEKKGQGLALFDFNNDKMLEIAFNSEEFLSISECRDIIHVLDYRGEYINKNWPKFLPSDFVSNPFSSSSTIIPAISDIDGDGQVDIITGSRFPRVYIFNSEAEDLVSWPKEISEAPLMSPAVGDLDNDGDVEVVIASINGEVYVFDSSSSYGPETIQWPMHLYDTRHTACFSCDETVDLGRPPSKVLNLEYRDLTGQLTTILQKKVGEEWQDENIVFNEQVTIPAQGLIKLDNGQDNLGNQVFEGWNNLNVQASSAGQYRVYAKFELYTKVSEANWEFRVV